MLAYHNDPQLKQQILEQLQRHYDADEIVKGQYWENGKGCAVGCTLHTDQHNEYETRFGIPVRLAHLEDVIFEGLPSADAKSWPIRFMSSINVGADLSAIWREFVVWLLIDPADGVIQYTTPGTEVYEVIMQVATLYQQEHTQQQMLDAAYAAINAAVATTDYTAVFSAYTAANAAHAAAYTDRAAALAAHAAYAAAYVASACVVGFYAYTASVVGFYAAYTKMSNKLIELLQKRMPNVSLPQ